MSKKRLVILSDLWGKSNAKWIESYAEKLTLKFEVIFYDSCELAGIEIETKPQNQEEVHKQFVEGGIEKAVNKLSELEKNTNSILLAFSIGGTIAWKYALKTTSIVTQLYCISSTRLRYEIVKPQCSVYLYYGTNDLFTPDKKWFEILHTTAIFKEGNHELYREQEFAKFICEEIYKIEKV